MRTDRLHSHSHMMQLIGVAVQQRPWLMVLEYLQYGDLRNLLKGCAAKGIELHYDEQLNFAIQVMQSFSLASLPAHGTT